MASITYFKAMLRCSNCGRDAIAWLYSTLGEKGSTYEVGDCPGDDIQPIDFVDTSFTVRAPGPDEPVHFLTSWTCEFCRLENFGEIVLVDGCVRSIDRAALDLATLARVHYIAETTRDMLEAIVGTPLHYNSGLRHDWLQMLRAALEAGKRW
jgi:hypothetical protein